VEVTDGRRAVGTEQVSKDFKITEPTLAQWRYLGKGPAFVKVGSAVRYRRSDVMRWLAENTRTATNKRSA
jgi:predicted DNA-binding transcriptional regulator AlpA